MPRKPYRTIKKPQRTGTSDPESSIRWEGDPTAARRLLLEEQAALSPEELRRCVRSGGRPPGSKNRQKGADKKK